MEYYDNDVSVHSVYIEIVFYGLCLIIKYILSYLISYKISFNLWHCPGSPVHPLAVQCCLVIHSSIYVKFECHIDANDHVRANFPDRARHAVYQVYEDVPGGSWPQHWAHKSWNCTINKGPGSALYHPFGLNIFYSEEKDWSRHTTWKCPLQKKYVQKNLITHLYTRTHTHTIHLLLYPSEQIFVLTLKVLVTTTDALDHF